MGSIVRLLVGLAVATVVIATPIAISGASSTAPVGPEGSVPAAVVKYPNCAKLNAVYKHGVGRKGAVDKVSGRTPRVRNFTVNTAVYNANTGRDRDRDGIACEKL